MKKVEFKLPSTAWGFPIASARFFTFHYSLFTFHFSLKEESSLAFGSLAIFKIYHG